MITPDMSYLRERMHDAQDHESWFWARMAELGIPDGTAWETLREVLAEIQSGADHLDPWKVTADRLANGAETRP